MTKEKLLEIIQSLLNTDIDLGFLLKLKQNELEVLAACIRERVDHFEE
ncbi:MAG: hypothetical protein JRH13_14150 [Deltaproteobacteria bacterium]|nr:hypothetical protein [Deltaproteobacteria bacterium]MBW2017832.1 hypothetical protein [Deltaproteobacteria bacterium]MBW2130493.1 hypothetical protein [Deltaproteobacteria bacterium]MBW2303681.1 hypothetical protein [Deltaproteobacteria bacterium]